jgi:alanine racemase
MRCDGQRAQWIEVDAAALRHNLELLRATINPSTKLAGVVKANAYGHGLNVVAPVVAGICDWLAVHSAEEARQIRRLGIDLPVLIMGFLPPFELTDLDNDIHVLVSTEETLHWLGDFRRRAGTALPVHLKVETGTHRQGAPVGHISDLCKVAAREGLEVVGVATHFANIEDTLDHTYALQQLKVFRESVAIVSREIGDEPPFVHCACSAAALLFRETDFSLARVGISMYGHWPSRETQLSWLLDHEKVALQLKPSLTWRTVVGQIQEVKRGDTVGYGRTWTALRATQLAVLPVGYADGYPRVLGNRARALLGRIAAPVVGRVCMNIMLLDVTDIDGVETGDGVVLLGGTDSPVSAEELASLAGTINYELLARLSPQIPRVVVGE